MIFMFTFGLGHSLSKKVQPIIASDFESARNKMCEMHGLDWCWQYPLDEWKEVIARNPRMAELEELPIVYA